MLKNLQKESCLFSSRFKFIGFVIFVLAFILIVRLFQLQIIDREYYSTKSLKNSIDLAPIPPGRGLIYDRNGDLLAKNTTVLSLMITPSQAGDVDYVISHLQKIINITKNDIAQFNKQLVQHRRFDKIPIKLTLTENEAALIYERLFEFPGITIDAELIRQYPEADLFVHAIGYIGRVNKDDLESVDDSNYAATNFIGKIGIEKFYEEELHGTTGYRKIEVDASGRIIRDLDRISPKQGYNLFLTIDGKLQRAAYDALGENKGAVVAIDPSNGDVLALVSKPAYDPNLFVGGILMKDFDILQKDDGRPLYNRAIRGLYPPGSTIKPYIALAGLNYGVTNNQYQIFDPGWYQIPNTEQIFHDWVRSGHGRVNLTLAIIQSCDTYFYELAHKLGIKRVDEFLSKFGFGDETGIDLDEEIGGILPTPAWKKQHVGDGWFSGDTVNTGIGQGFIKSTPLQLAEAVSIIANRGKHIVPHLLYYKQQQSSGEKIYYDETELQNVNINKEYWNTVINAMGKVTVIGTGYHFGKTPYPVASKTGTAQVYSYKKGDTKRGKNVQVKLRDNSVFIAFAPIDKPKIAMAIVVENSLDAAAIARRVMDSYLIPNGNLNEDNSPSK